MNQLLHKPLRAFAWYAFLILACSIPAYYTIMDYIWVSELNEHNKIIAEKTKHNLNALAGNKEATAQSVEFWNKLQPNTDLQPADVIRADSIYNLYKPKPFASKKDIDRYQGLVTYFNIHGKPYKFIVETNVEESYETILSIGMVTMLFFGLLLLGFVFINKKISNRLWQPFYVTLQKLKSFDLDKQSKIRFEPTDIAEFEELNTALAKLIHSNIASFKQQKEFTENASHELQTPLAIIQSKLDLMRQNKSLDREQSQHIDEASKALARASRINKNLLLLAKIENHQYTQRELINLDGLIVENIDLLKDYAEGKKIQIQTQIKAGVEILGNLALVEILLSNLLLNAIKHNVEGGEVSVALNSNQLRVCNAGQESLQLDELFKRFSRTSPHVPGTGLGLAIVKEICIQHNWRVTYTFEARMHCFSVSFF
ncbi:sensor histidine kinase [Haliscomenobacter hydrossis]|uniref:histidine kinase n=1 Tax=Haliscomenobacter hydrossis (strain ATCC 27775 / DSM 1100 / LMG 10767 / O) TaxID=760192 RepID=F4L3X3_HALH1|nr:HAMP domain-containing sensor histidine kinase [Haliscomenobacter hydrossis]AEE49690.1 integral membrane sensor signal transduction histidine kinase [Haliscomenobacter hydrossis DSM 1100]